MSLAERVKQDAVAAWKNKSPIAGSLRTIVGDIKNQETRFNPARPLTDDEVIGIIRRHLNGVVETLGLLDKLTKERRAEEEPRLNAEKETLTAYLPQQLSEAEIEEIARQQTSQGKNLGQIMAYLRQEYGARVDGKTASAIVKRIIG